jgi:hypothetical protein
MTHLNCLIITRDRLNHLHRRRQGFLGLLADAWADTTTPHGRLTLLPSYV